MALNDDELRHLAISLLNAPSERDMQRKVGASDLAGGCDFCLASRLLGHSRDTPITSRAWLRARIGTALHLYAAQQAHQLLPDARIEEHIHLGTLGSYGNIGSTPDLALIGEGHLIDWKTSTIEKSAIDRDFLSIASGGQPIFGRDSRYTAIYKQNEKSGLFRKVASSISEVKYREALEKSQYKFEGYMRQITLYMWGLNKLGLNITRGSIMFVVVDGVGWFDNPAADGYADPTRMWNVWPFSFNYDEDLAEATWDRALRFWNALEAGASLADFERHPLCFPCGLETRASVGAPPEVDIQATLAA